jgi:hypothetical protein
MRSRFLGLKLLTLLVASCGGQSADENRPRAGSGGSATSTLEGGSPQGGSAAGGGSNHAGGENGGNEQAGSGSGGNQAGSGGGSAEAGSGGGGGRQCNAYPQCDAGDTSLSAACPPSITCYTRSLCGNTIICRDESATGGAGGAGGDALVCRPGFVDCDAAPGFCFQVLPDDDNDGCCGCLMP